MHYPKYTPKSTTPNGWIVYSYDKIRKELASCECGAQACFLKNNARANDPKQFALKLYDNKWEAVCAYERQRAAAEVGLAPPVGRLVQARLDKTNRIKMWGYQTCVAIPIEEDTRLYIELFPTVDHAWNGPTRLRRALRNVSLAGLPMNDLDERHLASPTPVKGPQKWCLGGDLHSHNVMEWMGNPVAIDFGYHCVLSARRGRINPVYNRA